MKKDWLETVGPHQICRIAHHYGIYKHLFDNAFFKPRINLNINFETEDASHPVYYGNLLTPSETRTQPSVKYSLDDSEANKSFWTLLLTNPDGNFEDANKEMVHWFT
jgi:large subunit ribosomal protein L38